MFVAGIDAHATYSVIAIVSNTGQLVAGPIRIKNTQEDRLSDLLQQYLEFPRYRGHLALGPQVGPQKLPVSEPGGSRTYDQRIKSPITAYTHSAREAA